MWTDLIYDYGAYVAIFLLFLLMVLSVPVFVSMGLAAFLASLLLEDPFQVFRNFINISWQGASIFELVALPLFILTGTIMQRPDAGRDLFEARALGIQGLLAVGALAYLLFASSPFLRLDPAPFQGAGLNPLLQDPALSFHPPMLYLGYVGYSFVFALAAAGMMEARVDSVWAREARRWSLAAFIPLSLGIALGSYLSLIHI